VRSKYAGSEKFIKNFRLKTWRGWTTWVT